MSQLQEITNESITFGKDKAPLHVVDLKFNSEVSAILRLAKSIQGLLAKNPIIPIVCSFDLDEVDGTRLFSISDRRNLIHLASYGFKCDVLLEKPGDIKLLESILAKLKDKDMMAMYREAYRVGASFIKLLLRSESYLEKYVDIVTRKARVGRIIWHDIRYLIGWVASITFVVTTGMPILLPL